MAELLSAKRVGRYTHLTLLASEVAARFRPGTLLAVAVGGPLSDRLLRRAVPIFRATASSSYRSTVELLVDAEEPGLDWLATLGAGAPVDVIGPLGRPFALPKEPVTCTLVGEGAAAAPLFSLAERLRERGCATHMLLTASGEGDLFGVLEARRGARSVLVLTEDGSVGIRGRVSEALPDLLARTATEVVYAAGASAMLHEAAAAAESHGAWSQTMVPVGIVCGPASCLSCVLPVVGEDGVSRMVRACVEGPVLRGDRVRWRDLGTVPSDVHGAGQDDSLNGVAP